MKFSKIKSAKVIGLNSNNVNYADDKVVVGTVGTEGKLQLVVRDGVVAAWDKTEKPIPEEENVVVKKPKPNVFTRGTRINWDDVPTVSRDAYQGHCMDYNCNMRESKLSLDKFFAELGDTFTKTMDHMGTRYKLSRKLEIVHSKMTKKYSKLDINYVKEDPFAEEDDTYSGSSFFPLVFTTIKSVKFTNNKTGKTYTFEDFKDELKAKGYDVAEYHKAASKFNLIKENFWKAHKLQKAGWVKMNPIFDNYRAEYGLEDNANIKAIRAAIIDAYPENPLVDIDYNAHGEAFCLHCGSTYVRAEKIKTHMEHLGIKSWNVKREMNEWAICEHDGKKYTYIFKNGKLLKHFDSIILDDLDIDIDGLDIDLDDADVDMDLDLDVDISNMDDDAELDLDLDVDLDIDISDLDIDLDDDLDTDVESSEPKYDLVDERKFDVEVEDYLTTYDEFNDIIADHESEEKLSRADFVLMGYFDDADIKANDETAMNYQFWGNVRKMTTSSSETEDLKTLAKDLVASQYKDIENYIGQYANGRASK